MGRPALALTALLLAGCKVTVEAPVPRPKEDPTPAWDAVLAEVVTADGYVDYDLLETHRDVLESYVAWLSDGGQPPNAMAAYVQWVNTYNAWVLYSVLLDGRPASVKDVDLPGWWPGPPGASFFQQRQFRFGPDLVSLAEAENERLRGRRQDLRVHGAINCASRSCPPLKPGVYHFEGFDVELDSQMRRWINDPDRGVRVEDGVVVASPIFDWYSRDFWYWTAGDDLCQVVLPYAEGALEAQLELAEGAGCPHRFFEYDWSLNDASGR